MGVGVLVGAGVAVGAAQDVATMATIRVTARNRVSVRRFKFGLQELNMKYYPSSFDYVATFLRPGLAHVLE